MIHHLVKIQQPSQNEPNTNPPNTVKFYLKSEKIDFHQVYHTCKEFPQENAINKKKQGQG